MFAKKNAELQTAHWGKQKPIAGHDIDSSTQGGDPGQSRAGTYQHLRSAILW
jgi:hypothetical protein